MPAARSPRSSSDFSRLGAEPLRGRRRQTRTPHRTETTMIPISAGETKDIPEACKGASPIWKCDDNSSTAFPGGGVSDLKCFLGIWGPRCWKWMGPRLFGRECIGWGRGMDRCFGRCRWLSMDWVPCWIGNWKLSQRPWRGACWLLSSGLLQSRNSVSAILIICSLFIGLKMLLSCLRSEPGYCNTK